MKLPGLLLFLMVSAATFFIIRRIIKLPGKYERKPKVISAWASLDEGIDPTVEDAKKKDES